MMRDKLRGSVSDPYFRLTLMLGVNGLIDASRQLTSIGIDVNKLITLALKDISSQLNNAAYEITDLDALLQEAQAIGDEVVETQEITGTVTPNTTEESDNSSKRDFEKSD
jgi:hypothetical protein